MIGFTRGEERSKEGWCEGAVEMSKEGRRKKIDLSSGARSQLRGERVGGVTEETFWGSENMEVERETTIVYHRDKADSRVVRGLIYRVIRVF